MERTVGVNPHEIDLLDQEIRELGNLHGVPELITLFLGRTDPGTLVKFKRDGIRTVGIHSLNSSDRSTIIAGRIADSDRWLQLSVDKNYHSGLSVSLDLAMPDESFTAPGSDMIQKLWDGALNRADTHLFQVNIGFKTERSGDATGKVKSVNIRTGIAGIHLDSSERGDEIEEEQIRMTEAAESIAKRSNLSRRALSYARY